MQDRMYQTPVRDVAYLRQRLINTWNDLSQSIVNDAVYEWRKREKRLHFRPVWIRKEDILNTCCNYLGWVQTGCVDKLDALLVCATKMCDLFGKVIIFATVQQQYVVKVGKSIIVVLQINSV